MSFLDGPAVALVLSSIIFLLATGAFDRPFVWSISVQQLPSALYHKIISLDRSFSGIQSRRTTLAATSSSDLKERKEHIGCVCRTVTASGNNGTKDATVRARKYPSGSVVSRLKQAAMQAAAAVATEQLQENIQMKNSFFSNHSSLSSKVATMNDQKKIGTLRELTNEIDLQLYRARALPWGQYQTHMLYHNQQARFQRHPHHMSVLPRDSMTAIITHNNQNQVTARGVNGYTSTFTHQPNINMTTTTSQRILSPFLITTLRHIAIILTKRSIMKDGRYMITSECAGRIQRLVHAMKYENYKPSVVVIVGERHANIHNSTYHGSCQQLPITTAVEDVMSTSDADLGYAYFVHLLSASNDQSNLIDLSNITFHFERSTISTRAFENITAFIQQEFLPQWLEDAIVEAESYQIANEGTNALHLRPKQQQQPLHRRWKLHLQFALISSDYHLCILNDIHVRSPGQSFIRALDRWSLSSLMKNVTSTYRNTDHFHPSSYYAGIQLETSWIYMYATVANIRRLSSQISSQSIEPFTEKINENDSDFELSLFTESCYQRAQELIPVLQNLRGVVANTEFFQRDNYRVLVQARRSLVSGMERLYQQQPSLSAVHKVLSSVKSSHTSPRQTSLSTQLDGDLIIKRNGVPLDVVLEGALLSLGRCLDLVRPAGLLTGSVPVHDFKLAAMILDQAVGQTSIACDPDQPLNFSSTR